MLTYNLIIVIVRCFLKIFFPYQIVGKKNISNLDKKVLICSNHVSNLDALFISVGLNCKIYFLAKSELFRNALVSYFLKKLGAISIKRGSNDVNAINKAMNVLNSGGFLGIFIEGTRSKTGEFLRPKSGAAIIACDTNSTVLPVCITPQNGKKIKIFSKTIINFGKPITNVTLKEKSYKEIRSVTEQIMSEIKCLR